MATQLLNFPKSARALTAIGDETARATEEFFQHQQATLFSSEDDPSWADLADALRKQKWTDIDAAQVIRCYARVLDSGRSISAKQLTQWILAHDRGTAADTLRHCIEVEPPTEVDIQKVLSRVGSQKIVFLALWRPVQREVVLKRVLGESRERTLSRELQLHPSTMGHPNIIETHFVDNKHGERFLIETRVRPLHDGWRTNGVGEAANLLCDLARAVRFLHVNHFVHGDIKPDNVGIKNNRFLLLDFGICRRAQKFTEETTPTGSLRTRAPELLLHGSYVDPVKTDIWALGATVFNTIVGRFPFIFPEDVVPPIWMPSARSEFERKLISRIRNEWNSCMTLDSIPEPLRHILAGMLKLDVKSRLASAELLEHIEDALPAFLRSNRGPVAPTSRFLPREEFEQIKSYLSQPGRLELLPKNRRYLLAERLREFASVVGFSESELAQMQRQMDRLEGR